MGYNKIPLALGFNDTTGNASGLVEFVLNLSDVGDVCTNAPVSASVLAYETDTSNWCPSTIVFPTGGGGSFGCGDLATCDLSALRNVCNNTASLNQVLALNSSNQFCPSTVVFPIPVTSVQSKTGDVLLTLDEINAAGNTSVGSNGDLTVGNGTLQTGISGTTNPGTLTVNGDTKFTVAGSTGDLKVGNVTYIRGADGDIEAGKDVVIGANSFTQTNAKIANVEERSLVITDSASSLSSVSGVSGSVVYFSGDTASPKLAGIPTIMEEAEVRVEDKVLKDISDVGYTTAAAGTVLTRIGSQWKAMTPAAFQQFNSGGTDSASYGAVALFDHGNGLSGLGDDDHPQYVLSGGSRAMSALTVTNGITANSLSATTIDFDPEGSLAINATNITATNLSGTGSVSAATIKAGTSVSSASVSAVALNATNASALNLTGTTITANDVNLSGNLTVPDYTGLANAGIATTLHREVGAPVASSNSTSLAEVAAFTLPANILTLGDIDIMIRGRQLAQGSNLRFNFKIAGTNILNSSISQGTFSDFTRYTMHIQISKMATDRQMVTARFIQGTGTGSAAGFSGWSSSHRDGIIHNEATGDESGTLALSLQAQQSNSSQTVSVDHFTVKLIPNPA